MERIQKIEDIQLPISYQQNTNDFKPVYQNSIDYSNFGYKYQSNILQQIINKRIDSISEKQVFTFVFFYYPEFEESQRIKWWLHQFSSVSDKLGETNIQYADINIENAPNLYLEYEKKYRGFMMDPYTVLIFIDGKHADTVNKDSTFVVQRKKSVDVYGPEKLLQRYFRMAQQEYKEYMHMI